MKIKNIILTGSEGLIGRSFRSYAEKKGYNLFCIDKKKNKRKNYYYCDITKERQVLKTINYIFKKTNVSLLINNAATNPTADNKLNGFKFSDYKLKDWKKNIEVDLHGCFLISKHVLKYFEKQNYEKILNISSIYGIIGADQKIYQKRKKNFVDLNQLNIRFRKLG